jgi:hypothetical protein
MSLPQSVIQSRFAKSTTPISPLNEIRIGLRNCRHGLGERRNDRGVSDGRNGAGFGRYSVFLTSAQDMQPTDSARGMMNTVYDSLLNGK